MFCTSTKLSYIFLKLKTFFYFYTLSDVLVCQLGNNLELYDVFILEIGSLYMGPCYALRNSFLNGETTIV